MRGPIKRAIAGSPAARLALTPEVYLALVGGRRPGRRLVARLPVRVPLDRCVGYTAFPYGADGWHYLVEVLRQIDRNPDLPAERSLLAAFHDRFQPTSASHILAGQAQSVDFTPPLGVMPWGKVTGSADDPAIVAKDWTNSRWYGPSSLNVVRDEYDRLRRAYASIRQHGYAPWRWGFIGGQFLHAADGSYRYVILQGNHRAAILAHLGAASCVVRLVEGRDPIIQEAALHRWPYVRSGACTADDARAYFRAYFTTSGREQARAFRLIA
jgi:hypothetical protein